MAINFNYNYPQLAREAGFKLRQFKNGPLDWRLMGSFEIERILREQNLEQIDGVLPHLSEAPLGSILETNILESGIAKYFLVSQFAIQYLLFCRKFLDETAQELRESYAKSQSEVARLKKATDEANNQVLQLNRRITQMEAIHEVIYPCALCPKNFISNDALNIHIGRKHPQPSSAQALLHRGNGDESPPVSGHKERMYNLSLINTIKLELEIKQLKERLNVAEQEIRERAVVPQQAIVAAVSSSPPAAPKRALKDVGIQNNLCDDKEKVDCEASGAIDHDDSGNDAGELCERKTQLDWLQDQVEHFEQWKQIQKMHSEASLVEINRKLNELTLALEAKRGERDSRALSQDFQRNPSPSVEDLDRLEQKVTEMSTSIADKLGEVVRQLEAGYNKKLKEMEHVLEQRIAEVGKGLDQIIPRHRDENDGIKFNGITCSTPEDNSRSLANKTYDIADITASKEQRQNPTAVEVVVMVAERRNDEELSLHSTESHRTYVKTKKKRVGKYDIKCTPSVTSTQTYDLTEASESLSEDLHSDGSKQTDLRERQEVVADKKKASDDELPELIPNFWQKTDAVGVELKPLPRTATAKKELHTISGNINLQRADPAKISRASAQPAAKQKHIFTQKDAKKLANKHLASLGCDPKAKSLSFSAMRRISYVLTENRNHLKQKYPQFYVTRNRIKKLVDKLCSAKLPESAEFMLQTKQVLQPPAAAPRNTTIQQSGTTSSAEENDTDEAAAMLSPSSLNENDSFKQRLESILGTPLRMPQLDELQSTTDAPQPVPRKRVMFNTFRHASAHDDSDHKKQQPRSELSPFAPYD